MAKKRFLGIITFFLLSISPAFAQEERSLSVTFTFYANSSVEASDIWVRYGSPDLRNVAESSDYKIAIKFKDGTSIEQFYDVIFLMAAETEEGPETFQVPYTLLNAEFAYKDNPDKIEVYHNSKMVYQKSLENLCNNDNICNNNETSISCSYDCSKSVKDGWCDTLQDGMCDPDCEETSDIDCSAREEIPTGKSKSFFSIILAVFVVGIIGVYIYKKKRKRYKINKKFHEATKRLHARKKKIKKSEVNDLIQKVRYGKKG